MTKIKINKMTDAQLDQFRQEMLGKPARDEKYFPVACILMRHIDAVEGR